MRRRTTSALASLASLALLAPALAACGAPAEPGPEPSASAPAEPAPPRSDVPEPDPVDPDEPTSWGPTLGELDRAAGLVAELDDAELVGQVIVGRYAGTDPAVPGDLVRDLHLAGVSVTTDNVLDAAQVEATAAAVREAAADREAPPIIGIDQEGGSVAHLRGIATDFPAFSAAGDALAADREVGGDDGADAVRRAAQATGLELRDLGFTWVFAPVADVTVGEADPTIGSRSPSADTELAAEAIGAAVRGYRSAAVVSTTKHFPGHGAATADSHVELPVLDSTRRELRRRDLPPFREAVRRGAPAIMMAHLDVPALDPGVPTSLSPAAYEMLRDVVGFEGVAITDSLGMGGVAGQDRPAVQALAAGADLLLMPVDTRETHRVVLDALTSGELDRDRLVEAATRVVALQLAQGRDADEHPTHDGVTTRAQRAAASLAEAAAR